MPKSDRLLTIVSIIEKEISFTAEMIAQRTGASLRTTYRDISALRRHGWRVPGAAGVGYVYRGRRPVNATA